MILTICYQVTLDSCDLLERSSETNDFLLIETLVSLFVVLNYKYMPCLMYIFYEGCSTDAEIFQKVKKEICSMSSVY